MAKELVDNALDAAEEAEVLPDVGIGLHADRIVITDNGPEIPAKVIEDVLDYAVRASSRDAYVSPTRGQQGNALKTVIAIPYVLSGCESGELAVFRIGEACAILLAPAGRRCLTWRLFADMPRRTWTLPVPAG